ncbi:SET domain-containing protein-lysine N-methyltransferase [uncultured Pseudodesulfovibrio sp.]|uniref:SET domain-containing protein n=1 Tax=uncultured Pseudodesulfovibrio sp. TaxID=2035858 RepID=UPI0029C8684C|nr:SET domain-containing protein-lysine N-methyltransferase [uncultured Pseudodesulfovibrio sp.]
MMHPQTEVRFVDPTIGYGVFAARDIPRGTIVYVRDRLEAAFAARSANRMDAAAGPGKTVYADESGVHMVSRDNARYVNHRCDCNVMTTAYGFEIAVRDIWKGQEICEEYGLFDLGREIPLNCGCTLCRKRLRPDDLERFHEAWDGLILDALTRVADVPQPLMTFMDAEAKQRLRAYLCGEEPYISVADLARHAPVALSAIPPDNPRPAPFGVNG